MDVRCDKCQARYRIDDARVGAQGLAMRCGKCGNTFRATREAAQPAAAAPIATNAAAAPPGPPATAPRPAPKPSAAAPKLPAAAGTVMFAAPPTSAAPVKPAGPAGVPAAAAPPLAPLPGARATPPKPVAAAPKAAGGPAGAVAPPLADEAAGRTMMFNAAPSLKTQPPRTPAGTVKPLSKPTDAAGATLVFGAAPAVAQRPKAPAKTDAGASATILFGKAPPSVARPPAAQVPTPPPQTPLPRLRGGDVAPAGAPRTHPSAPDAPGTAGPSTQMRDAGDDHGALAEDGHGGNPAADEAADRQSGSEAADALEEPAESEGEPPRQAPSAHGPPRALVIGVAAALALVLVLAGVVLAVKRLGHRAP
ncbi:MAG: zinc-ribbon domain-containing protein, partial [Myxococcales bacterium]